MGEPIIDVVPHAPRYMVRCSACGIFAEMLMPAEAANERDNHDCSAYARLSDTPKGGRMSAGRWTFKVGVDRVNRLEPKIVLTVNRQMRSGRLDFCELTEAEALTLAEELLHASNIMRPS